MSHIPGAGADHAGSLVRRRYDGFSRILQRRRRRSMFLVWFLLVLFLRSSNRREEGSGASVVTAFLIRQQPISKSPSIRAKTSHVMVKAATAAASVAGPPAATTSTSSTIAASSSSSSILPAEGAPRHYTSSRRRTVANRKTQLRWIAQRVQKIQQRETRTRQQQEEQQRISAASSSDDSSRSASSTSSNVGDHDAEQVVVQALFLLSTARSTLQVLEAQRLLRAARVSETQPVAVQERVVKAAAMTGLLSLAVSLTEDMLLRQKHVPSAICQDALCHGLRQAGRVRSLERILCQLGTVAQQDQQQQRVSTIAFNTYLAALCDIVMDRDAAMAQRVATPTADSAAATTTTTTAKHHHRYSLSREDALKKAWTWLRDAGMTTTTTTTTTQSNLSRSFPMSGVVVPDAVSYATVLQAAGSAGNSTMVDEIWQTMKARQVRPNIVAYNSRLRETTTSNRREATTMDSQRRPAYKNDTRLVRGDAKILKVWDEEISRDPCVKPDKFTIDNLLLPLLRAGRVGDVEALLDTFVQRNSDSVVSNAFAAFLLKVVGGGELASARALFEMYILPTLSPVVMGDAGAMIRMVRPTTRHFNTLLEGYRKRVQNGRLDKMKTIEEQESDAEEGWALYRLMRTSLGVRPDEYTFTSMMGLSRNATELSELLFEATSGLNIQLSAVVLRAALTAFGDLGDPSSALWLFANFPEHSTRTWNVMLGTFAESGRNRTLRPATSVLAKTFSGSEILDVQHQQLNDLLLRSTVVDTTQLLLNAMCEGGYINKMKAPPSDSQTFCVAASALQFGPTGASLATALFRNASSIGIPADGRFINAVMRCFGNDIDAALLNWKKETRPKCVAFEKRKRTEPPSRSRPAGKNLLAAYNGLLYVSGRALRPDIAVRIVYAMSKEGLVANENSLNSYRSGKRLADGGTGFRSQLARRLKLIDPYESILYVECTKYDSNDRRRTGEQRVRIIV